jgi:hypothetical protein
MHSSASNLIKYDNYTINLGDNSTISCYSHEQREQYSLLLDGASDQETDI